MQHNPKSIKDVIDYVRSRNKVCKEWNDGQLASAILKAIREDTFVWVTDSHDNISGMVIGDKDPVAKIIHIKAIQADSVEDLKYLVAFFVREYDPEVWTLSANRRGRYIHYNTKRLCQIILSKETYQYV